MSLIINPLLSEPKFGFLVLFFIIIIIIIIFTNVNMVLVLDFVCGVVVMTLLVVVSVS